MSRHEETPEVARILERDGAGYDFVQLMRLLMRLYPDRAPVGRWADPRSEIARLSVPPTLAFPPSEVASVTLPVADADGEKRPAAVSVRFLGLTGPQGVLPTVYTAHLAERTRSRDTAFRDFLDIFHHRVLSLFYRAWEYSRPTLAAERGAEDVFRSHLLDLVGAGTPALRDHDRLSADLLAHYAGLLSLRTRPAAGLAQIVADHFRVATSVEQFIGEWRILAEGGQLCLGDDGVDGILGGAVLGNAVYDPQARVRLRLGPLTRDEFDAFLPGGVWHQRLVHVARMYADDQVSVEAQLVLRKEAATGVTIGAPHAPTLGFGSWLRSKPARHDADDVHLLLC